MHLSGTFYYCYTYARLGIMSKETCKRKSLKVTQKKEEAAETSTIHHSDEDIQKGKWLTNEHIKLAQTLLKAQFPHTAIHSPFR